VIDTFTKTCRHFAADACEIDASRVTATGRETPEGIEITILIDGQPPNAEQKDAIDLYMNRLMNASTN